MAMTPGIKEHCLGERMRHLENDASASKKRMRLKIRELKMHGNDTILESGCGIQKMDA